jgi:MYXO-CTERM domain-containing protein
VVEMNLWRVEYILAGVFVVLGTLTAVVPDWIEVVFKVDPDAGNGSLEWALVAAFGLLAAIAALLARRRHQAAAQVQ